MLKKLENEGCQKGRITCTVLSVFNMITRCNDGQSRPDGDPGHDPAVAGPAAAGLVREGGTVIVTWTLGNPVAFEPPEWKGKNVPALTDMH